MTTKKKLNMKSLFFHAVRAKWIANLIFAPSRGYYREFRDYISVDFLEPRDIILTIDITDRNE